MLATLVIGLREGLEAALIVSIIAAFLRRNGESLRPMWLGVILAVVLSIAVGAALSLIEQALPQSKQEALETVIGLVAVFFVTGMIAWMNTHSRSLKGDLETEAAAALGSGSVYALSLMAFLAVLKEGFETAVFLLATFSAAQSASMAAIGAVVGLILAVIIGWGIYMGGIKINLSRFFRFTGVFLILVAAGLMITVLRTAHEAGWLNAGQQLTVNLSWLVAPGTVQSALITGVLGIPADPRLIEVIGWVAYLVPVSLYISWPASKRPSPRGAARLRMALAVVLLGVAVVLPLAYPSPSLSVPREAPVVRADDADTPVGAARLTLEPERGTPDGGAATLEVTRANGPRETIRLPETAHNQAWHNGFPVDTWTVKQTAPPSNVPATLTVNQVVALSGGRVPIGLNPSSYPGPYDATWTVTRSVTVWAADQALLNAAERVTTLVKLSGGGLTTARTIRVRRVPEDMALPVGWTVSPTYTDKAYRAVGAFDAQLTERHLWAHQLPIVLAVIALALLLFGLRGLMRPPLRPSRGAGGTGTPKPSEVY